MNSATSALISIAGAALLALTAPGFAKGPPKPLQDWPCETPLAGPLDSEALWPGAATASENQWAADPDARELVEFLTAGENSPAMGRRKIDEFAAQHGPLKPETAMLVVSGMVERGNILRRIMLSGIKKQIIKSHVLAEAIEAQDVKIKATTETDEETKKQAAALQEARRQNANMLDDADETAEHLCRRLIYDETKLRTLAEALRAHTLAP